MFQYPLITGDASTVLDEPTSIVITGSLGKALFNDEGPLGKIIRVDNEHDLTVTGILKDIPSNSSFQFDCLLPYSFRLQTNKSVSGLVNLISVVVAFVISAPLS